MNWTNLVFSNITASASSQLITVYEVTGKSVILSSFTFSQIYGVFSLLRFTKTDLADSDTSAVFTLSNFVAIHLAISKSMIEL